MTSAHQVRRATLDRCREIAVRVSGVGDPELGELPLVEMPPVPSDGVEPAIRRLRALEAVDTLRRQLKLAPRRPELHFQLGLIYLWSLENSSEAAGRLCQALLLAHKARSVAVPRYERALLSAWMQPGMEPKLELALRPGERNLPWRDALKYARALRGVTWEARAAALDGAITAQRVLRNSRLMPRRRSRGTLDDVIHMLEAWTEPGGGPVWAVVSFPARKRGRVARLAQRNGEVPPEVWATPGPGPRWLLYARGKKGLAPLIEYAEKALRGIRVGLSLRQGSRRLYLAGRLKGRNMKVDARSSKPEASQIESALTKLTR